MYVHRLYIGPTHLRVYICMHMLRLKSAAMVNIASVQIAIVIYCKFLFP